MQLHRASLRSLALRGGAGRRLTSEAGQAGFADVKQGRWIQPGAGSLVGASVLIATDGQLAATLALLDLDGVAGRVLLCPPGVDAAHLPAILDQADVDTVVTDGRDVPSGLRTLTVAASPCGAPLPDDGVETEWVLFTSGTTGRPKLVRHTLGSLTGPLADGLVVPDGSVWSTFYDTRRYGGLQILLRALLGGGSMVFSSDAEPVGAFLQRAGREGVTHISGTPSHWRRALMSPDVAAMNPAYVRLSGEVADQGVLDRLHAAYPRASIAHAYASTEAGVAFDVRDGLAGFPAAMLEPGAGAAEMRVVDGTLRIRSRRTASGYIGAALPGEDGFVDTGDQVERRGDRYYFAGRREGVINVGGQKIYPEEVEAVLNAHPAIRMSRVWPRRSPVTGAIVAADLVLEGEAALATVRDSILAACRAALPPHKVPVSLRAVPSLAITAAGKLVRNA